MIKGIALKICMLCFALIYSVLLKLLRVWILHLFAASPQVMIPRCTFMASLAKCPIRVDDCWQEETGCTLTRFFQSEATFFLSFLFFFFFSTHRIQSWLKFCRRSQRSLQHAALKLFYCEWYNQCIGSAQPLAPVKTLRLHDNASVHKVKVTVTFLTESNIQFLACLLQHSQFGSVWFLQALGPKTTRLNQRQISCLALHLMFHRYSPFNCCLSVVL